MRGWPPRLPMCGPAILPPILGVTMENSVHGWRAAVAARLFLHVICGKARMTCAPWADKIQFRLGSGLSVLQPGEATEIIIAGMGAETVLEILDAAPWVRNEQYNFVFVPATKHSVLRKGLAQRGFALKSETLCRAAGRLYTVINAQYTGRAAEPTGLSCLCGKTQGQPEAQAYREQQLVKLKKYRLGLAPGPQADGVDALIQEMEDGLWP